MNRSPSDFRMPGFWSDNLSKNKRRSKPKRKTARDMADYLSEHHVSDDFDDGPLAPTVNEDDMIEMLYRSTVPDVYSFEAPPRMVINESLRLETQYSEGSCDEDDSSSPPDYGHITDVLRKVDPDYPNENYILNDLVSNKSMDLVTIELSKPPSSLNPLSEEFTPRSLSNTPRSKQALACETVEISAALNVEGKKDHNNSSIPRNQCETAEKSASFNLEEKKDRKKCRNVAIASLQLKEYEKKIRLKELDKKNKLMTPQDFVLHTSDTVVPHTANSETPVRLSTPPCETPKSSVSEPSVCLPSRSEEEKSPLEMLPKKKKSKDFVPSAKANQLYEQIKKREKQAEIEKNAERTTANNLSDFIELKLREKEEERIAKECAGGEKTETD